MQLFSTDLPNIIIYTKFGTFLSRIMYAFWARLLKNAELADLCCCAVSLITHYPKIAKKLSKFIIEIQIETL